MTIVERICYSDPGKVYDFLLANGYDVENGNQKALCEALFNFGKQHEDNFKKALSLHPDKELILKTFGTSGWAGDELIEEEIPVEKPVEAPAEKPVETKTDIVPFFKTTQGMIITTVVVTVGIIAALSAILKK